jgi:hypothetical protein
MKLSIVIPTYCCKPEYYSPTKKPESFSYFDHPTPLNREGTLERLLESVKILKIPKGIKLNLVIIPVGNSPGVQEEVERKVSRTVKKFAGKFETIIFRSSKLKKIERYTDSGIFRGLIGLENYPKIRNLCILYTFIIGSDVTILIDDDEIFGDPEFLENAIEFIGKKRGEKTVQGVSGYYLNINPENPHRYTYLFDSKFIPWWKRLGRIWNTAFYIDKYLWTAFKFDQILEISSFALGGNMVLSRELTKNIPFDPQIPRGEDMDYFLNAKLKGYPIYFDKNLSIKHLPPKYKVEDWEKLRMNMFRFLLARDKIGHQNLKGFKSIPLEAMMPYPGQFLRGDLGPRIFFANIFLSLNYLLKGKITGFKRSLENICLAFRYLKNKRRRKNVLKNYSEFHKDWKELIKDLDKNREKLIRIVKE